ncbi:hypothetical protein X975_08114, partial [Stegodyphus mimosarum]
MVQHISTSSTNKYLYLLQEVIINIAVSLVILCNAHTSLTER